MILSWLQEKAAVTYVVLFVAGVSFAQYIGNLELLVHGYNKLKQTLLEVEYPLIEDELRTVDEELQAAATSLTWQDDCWEDIKRVRMATSELERRVERAQNNVRVIQQTLRAWAECPLLPRREHRRETTMTWEDKSELFTKKYKRIREDGCKIHNLVEVLAFFFFNFYLFICCTRSYLQHVGSSL